MFEFCPNCSSKNISFLENKKIVCQDCNFEYYHNVAGAVAVILKKEDSILLTQRNQEPQKGKWDLPGGFIDPNETAEHCCFRELNEELNIKIDTKKLQYIASEPNTYLYKNILYNTIDMFFLLEFQDEITNFDSIELQAFHWIKFTEVSLETIAFDSQRKVLNKIIDNLNYK